MGVHVSVPHSNKRAPTRRPKVSTVRIEMMVAATNTAPVMTDDSRAASWPMPRLLNSTGA